MTAFLNGLVTSTLGLAVVSLAWAGGVNGKICLEITGASGTTFSGKCVLTSVEGPRNVDLAGEVPQRYLLEGAQIDCTVVQSSTGGHLEVQLLKDGSTSRSRTGGKNSTVKLRMR